MRADDLDPVGDHLDIGEIFESQMHAVFRRHAVTPRRHDDASFGLQTSVDKTLQIEVNRCRQWYGDRSFRMPDTEVFATEQRL